MPTNTEGVTTTTESTSMTACRTRGLRNSIVLLKWTHAIIIVMCSVLIGVGMTMLLHCNANNNNHNVLFSPTTTTTSNQNKHGFVTAETTRFKTTVGTTNTTTTKAVTKLRVNNDNNNNNETMIHPIETLEQSGPWPKVAWLLSFPNSGTSFTSKMIRHVSQQSTATNYGEEMIDPTTGTSMSVYEPNRGPFWIDPQTPGLNYTRPTIFALTKTHCGGRCEKCGPSKFVENTHSFLTQCLSGKIAHMTSNNSSGDVVKTRVEPYDRNLVKRAVHLIRSPFDNVVSRFHLELHEAAKRNDTAKLSTYPSSRIGFRQFCIDLNALYAKEEASSRFLDARVFDLVRDVPCRDDFFRFVQWHNLAFVTTQSMQIPTLVVHYENYETKYSETVTELLEFLHLESKGELIEFVKGKEYDDYFTLEERAKVKEAMQLMALSSTWEQISHYF